MTRTPDEIKKGLECCTHNSGCDACPYRDISVGCRPARNADALALIQQIEVDNSQLLNYIRLLQAERDAAVADLKYVAVCETCKEFRRSALTEPCLHCTKYGLLDSENKYEWRGVQKEDGNASD